MLCFSIPTLTSTFAGCFGHSTMLLALSWLRAGPAGAQSHVQQGALQLFTEENTIPAAAEFVVVLQRGLFAGHSSTAAVLALSIHPVVRNLLTETLWWKPCPEASSKSFFSESVHLGVKLFQAP